MQVQIYIYVVCAYSVVSSEATECLCEYTADRVSWPNLGAPASYDQFNCIVHVHIHMYCLVHVYVHVQSPF